MAKGKNRVQHLGSQGTILSDKYADWDFIYDVTATKSNLYNIGDRVVLPDGRVFRYGLSSGACWSGQGVCFIENGFQTYDNVVTSVAKGGKSVTIDGGTHDTIVVDQLRGGYVNFFVTDNTDNEFRGIVGNTAATTGVDFTLDLDASISTAYTTSTNCEIFWNPYSSLKNWVDGMTTNLSRAGLAAAYVSASGRYFWVQTWGPCWIAPQTFSGATTNGRAGFFRHDGTIEPEIATASRTGLNTTQHAGFLITEGDASGAGPLFMLQISP